MSQPTITIGSFSGLYKMPPSKGSSESKVRSPEDGAVSGVRSPSLYSDPELEQTVVQDTGGKGEEKEVLNKTQEIVLTESEASLITEEDEVEGLVELKGERTSGEGGACTSSASSSSTTSSSSSSSSSSARVATPSTSHPAPGFTSTQSLLPREVYIDEEQEETADPAPPPPSPHSRIPAGTPPSTASRQPPSPPTSKSHQAPPRAPSALASSDARGVPAVLRTKYRFTEGQLEYLTDKSGCHPLDWRLLYSCTYRNGSHESLAQAVQQANPLLVVAETDDVPEAVLGVFMNREAPLASLPFSNACATRGTVFDSLESPFASYSSGSRQGPPDTLAEMRGSPSFVFYKLEDEAPWSAEDHEGGSMRQRLKTFPLEYTNKQGFKDNLFHLRHDPILARYFGAGGQVGQVEIDPAAGEITVLAPSEAPASPLTPTRRSSASTPEELHRSPIFQHFHHGLRCMHIFWAVPCASLQVIALAAAVYDRVVCGLVNRVLLKRERHHFSRYRKTAVPPGESSLPAQHPDAPPPSAHARSPATEFNQQEALRSPPRTQQLDEKLQHLKYMRRDEYADRAKPQLPVEAHATAAGAAARRARTPPAPAAHVRSPRQGPQALPTDTATVTSSTSSTPVFRRKRDFYAGGESPSSSPSPSPRRPVYQLVVSGGRGPKGWKGKRRETDKQRNNCRSRSRSKGGMAHVRSASASATGQKPWPARGEGYMLPSGHVWRPLDEWETTLRGGRSLTPTVRSRSPTPSPAPAPAAPKTPWREEYETLMQPPVTHTCPITGMTYDSNKTFRKRQRLANSVMLGAGVPAPLLMYNSFYGDLEFAMSADECSQQWLAGVLGWAEEVEGTELVDKVHAVWRDCLDDDRMWSGQVISPLPASDAPDEEVFVSQFAQHHPVLNDPSVPYVLHRHRGCGAGCVRLVRAAPGSKRPLRRYSFSVPSSTALTPSLTPTSLPAASPSRHRSPARSLPYSYNPFQQLSELRL